MAIATNTFIKRALPYALLVLFMTSCHKQAPEHSWECASISPCAELSLPPKNAFRNLEIVLQKEKETPFLLINVYGIPLKPKQDGTIDVALNLQETSQIFSAKLLEGGQRILLPEIAQKAVLLALEQKKSFTLQAGRYCTEIHYEGFDESLMKFNT